MQVEADQPFAELALKFRSRVEDELEVICREVWSPNMVSCACVLHVMSQVLALLESRLLKVQRGGSLPADEAAVFFLKMCALYYCGLFRLFVSFRLLLAVVPPVQSTSTVIRRTADYYRYMSEFKPKAQGVAASLENSEGLAGKYYGEAMDLAALKLAATHPIRLGLALNYSVRRALLSQQLISRFSSLGSHFLGFLGFISHSVSIAQMMWLHLCWGH